MLPAVHSCGSAALHRGLGDRRGIAASLGVLGMVATDRGEYARAAALHEEGLRIGRDIGAREVLAEALEGLVWVAAADGQAPRAARLGGAAEALREALGAPLAPADRAGHERAVHGVQAALGEAAFAAAWAEGWALSLEAAVALALAGHGEAPAGG